METHQHRTLKREAVALLAEAGVRIVGYEVPSPVPKWRVDVGAYADPVPRRARSGWGSSHLRTSLVGDGPGPRTVFIECKAFRADFLKDSGDTERLLTRRVELCSAKRELEERIIRHCEPDLRQIGSSLFPDLDQWRFGLARLPSYRRILKEIESLDARLHGQTKFWTMAKYRLADRLYIAAPKGTVGAKELPCGWGLLEADPDALDGEGPAPLSVKVEAPDHRATDERRQRVLRNIALAGSRVVIRRSGGVIGGRGGGRGGDAR